MADSIPDNELGLCAAECWTVIQRWQAARKAACCVPRGLLAGKQLELVQAQAHAAITRLRDTVLKWGIWIPLLDYDWRDISEEGVCHCDSTVHWDRILEPIILRARLEVTHPLNDAPINLENPQDVLRSARHLVAWGELVNYECVLNTPTNSIKAIVAACWESAKRRNIAEAQSIVRWFAMRRSLVFWAVGPDEKRFVFHGVKGVLRELIAQLELELILTAPSPPGSPVIAPDGTPAAAFRALSLELIAENREKDRLLARAGEVDNAVPGSASSTVEADPAPAQIEPLHPDDVRILQALAKAGTTQTQYDLETATGISRRTISPRLAALRERGLTWRPHGERGGEAISDAGRRLVSPDDGAAGKGAH